MTMSARTYCSFCGKSDLEVDVMLAGPVLAFICDECVELAVETVAQKRAWRAEEERIRRWAIDRVRCDGCRPEPVIAAHTLPVSRVRVARNQEERRR